MRWVLVYRDKTVRQQGDGMRFSECDPHGIATVGVDASAGCKVVMAVPDGAVVEMFVERTTDLTIGASGEESSNELPPCLKFGWRLHDGTRREAWLRVGATGLVESIDPNRPWPENEGEPNLRH